MLVWIGLLGGSMLIGVACALVSSKRRALVAAAALPWLALLAMLLFYEYVMPYEGGGASMWPIAQLFGGTIAAAVGLVSAAVTRHVRRARQ